MNPDSLFCRSDLPVATFYLKPVENRKLNGSGLCALPLPIEVQEAKHGKTCYFLQGRVFGTDTALKRAETEEHWLHKNLILGQ